MSEDRCAHCRRYISSQEREDSAEAGMRRPTCWTCADLAVLGEPCPYCGRTPDSGRCAEAWTDEMVGIGDR